MAAPPHHPAKLPFLIGLVVVLSLEVIVAAVSGTWIFAAIGVALVVWLAAAIRTVRDGRNPWWTRAPLDYRRHRR